MRVMVTTPGARGPRHVVVEAPEGATVGDLQAALALPVSGGSCPRTLLRHGHAVGPPVPQPERTGLARVVVAAGPDAGGSVPLLPGRWVTVGRAASCDLVVRDPTLSREHLRVRHERSGVVVEDLGSTNGLRWSSSPDDERREPRSTPPGASAGPVPWPAGGCLEVGASRLVLVLEPSAPAAGRERSGRFLVTPWPRAVQDGRALSLSTPTAARPREVRAPSAWVWALPLVASVVVAAVLRMPTMLIFGLMAPTMVLGHHLGERRSARLENEAAGQDHAQARDEIAAAAARALTDELHLLRCRHPGVLGAVLSLLPRPTTALWSRTGEPLEVVLGEGDAASGVELDGVRLRHADAPVVLDLSQPVTVVGRPHLRDAAVRGWVLQLACGHPPSDLSLTVDTNALPGADWDLLAWLPHTRPRSGPRTRQQVAWACPDGVLLLDGTSQAPPPGAAQVRVESPISAVLRRPGREDVRFRPTLVGLPLARSLARRLAGLDHDEGASAPGGGSRAPALGDLLHWPVTEDDVRRSWSAPHPQLRAPIGTDDAGAPLEVDLARDGPHALVAGTTGTGKSELLRTLVTGLALRNTPSALSLLLIDYKGGSSLDECAALPHSTGLVTDLDPHLAERVLVSLRAELRRREAVLARAGARDVGEYGGADLPRLLVVVDEFRVLTEELPDFLPGLVRLAAVGRSLGVHLVLATQRPAGAVSADLRANVNLRIALRVRDAADSLDVLEVPDAASLPEDRPGRALLRTGAEPPRRVQVAPAAPGAGTDADPGWRLEEVDGVWGGWAGLHAPTAVRAVRSSLGDLSGPLARVAADDGLRAMPVWCPPLGTSVPSTVPGAWALADRPELQRQDPLRWDARGHVAVAGAARSGRTTAARSLMAGAGPTWLYVVDPARGLEGTELSTHPGIRAWVGPHDPAHAVRVLEVLTEVVDERLASGAAPQGPPVVLVVDGWDRFVDLYGDTAQGRARELALRVLRDGAAAGVVALLTGDRSLLLGAVASAMPETWALRLNDPGDLALAGLRPHQVPGRQAPGRVVRTRDALVAQVVLPPQEPAAPVAPDGTPPRRVVSLPTGPGRTATAWAVGGDEADDVELPGAPFLVVGPPGSGVTTTLAALGARTGGEILRLGPDQVEDTDLLARRPARPGTTVMVDDAHLLAGTRLEECVLAWAQTPGARLVVGAELEASGSLFRGLVPHVARHRRGLVLQPSTAAHGALLGVRVPVGDRPVPGRGVLVDRGRCTRVQVLPVSRSAPP